VVVPLADPVPVSDLALAAIAERFGLRWDRAERLDSAGIINTIYTLGSAYVLRVPRRHAAHVAQARREARVIPAAVAAGVRTAALVAFDDACDLLPAPYLIVDRLSGAGAEPLPPGTDPAGLWRAVGRDLARLHAVAGVRNDGDGRAGADPRALVERRVDDGWLSALDGRWLTGWLDRLAAAGAGTAARPCLVHGDVQPANVLVAGGGYEALIDWGCSRVDDPAADFLAMPLAAVPELLAGHREVGALPDDDGAEARILWRRLRLVLEVLPRGAAPGMAWGERPVAWLVDLLRFFAEPPGRWRDLAPPGPPPLA